MASLIFSISCIDFRFDAMIAEFYKSINKEDDYFACSVAGSAMVLGHKTFSCKSKRNSKNATISLFKKNLIENIKIALSLKPITEIYLLNHQDCGAIKAFLPWSGYPKVLGENNKKEIIINSKLLTYAANYIKRVFPDIKLTLGIVDINGTIATYNIHTKVWTVIYIGKYNLSSGLWHGLVIGDTYKN
jgi:hypothetical protein